MAILNKRASGVLMHISSLPGNTGIGTLGKCAYDFVDYLSNAGQTYWQILPICPTGYGDSPYQSFSTCAGNPYFIDFDLLVEEGYLNYSDFELIDWGKYQNRVDYGLLYQKRRKVFEIVEKKFQKNIPEDFNSFCAENADWLDDYALFMTIKDSFGGGALASWTDDLRLRKPEAIDSFTAQNKKQIFYYKMLQYFFFVQWKRLKDYANSKNIKIVGDLPIYVSADSVDVWAFPENFALDENLRPVEVAGCPPDGFSATGQLWGNPVYNWAHLKETGYAWWKRRLEQSFKTYDVIRIDHFRGFEAYYCIPADAKTAANGVWRKGPDIDLFNVLDLKDKAIIAEDLGFLTEEVRTMLKASGFPGMKVLEFAFDSRDENDYLPENYTENSVVYTGTHDNDTILGWTHSAPASDVENALKYFSLESTNGLCRAMMNAALESKSNTCILTMQDILGKDSDARMNTPSTLGMNWQWRATGTELAGADWKWLKQMTEKSGRL